jgi:exodeoxyribonuclease VII small subunit
MTKSTFSLPKAIKRLEEIETCFTSSDFQLEQALELHKEALTIAKEVQEYLKQAEQALEKIDIAALRKEA